MLQIAMIGRFHGFWIGFLCQLMGCFQVFGVGTLYFPQSVASGDPTPDSVVLWTRLTVDGDVSVDRELSLMVVSEMINQVEIGTGNELSALLRIPSDLIDTRELYFRVVVVED